ncbi:hypothetical protein [Streptomyces tendae]|uniref:hypothetical protein n=1 Tax=Streptomyces tendae TaxID=1932 RepID=UPI00365391F3
MHDEQPSDRGAWVVLGGVHLLNRSAPRRPDEPIVLVRVPPQEVCRPATTVVVRWNALGPCLAEALHPGGTRLGAARIHGGALFPDALAGPALRGLVGTELEFKYTLDPAPNIWAASMELLKALRDGRLMGCRPEYREEFQIHHTENHLFDVTGPEPEIGYASFIPTVTAGHVLKRKWFAQDAFARREELTPGLDITPDRFEAFLREDLGLQVRAMPPFQRVRYDIQCESMRTGHVYGIFFDRCSLLAAPDVVLSQCELEYLRSRSILDHNQDEVLIEMKRINVWLCAYLASHGWAAEHTFYSKRSFLRDAIALRPDLATP